MRGQSSSVGVEVHHDNEAGVVVTVPWSDREAERAQLGAAYLRSIVEFRDDPVDTDEWEYAAAIDVLLAEVRRQAVEVERLRAGKAEQVERADKWLDRTQDSITYFTEALDILAHIVSQANVNQVGEGEWVERYDMPVGSIHKAIPFLQRHGIVVDVYGAIHRSPSIWPNEETK